MIEHLWLVFEDVRQCKGVNELYVEENTTLRKENEELTEINASLRVEIEKLKKPTKGLRKKGDSPH